MRAITRLVLLLATIFVLSGCATKMSEDDKWLWEGGTNAAPANR